MTWSEPGLVPFFVLSSAVYSDTHHPPDTPDTATALHTWTMYYLLLREHLIIVISHSHADLYNVGCSRCTQHSGQS